MFEDNHIINKMAAHETVPHSVAAVTSPAPDSSGRVRRTMRFCVDLTKDDDKVVYAILDWWKGQRCMATNIRKAILLFYDLAQGNTARLQEYFPHIVEALTGQAVRENADALAALTEGIVVRVTVAIDDAVSGITQQIVTLPADNQRAVQAQADYIGKQFEADETLIEVTAGKKASADDVGANFLKSMGGLFN